MMSLFLSKVKKPKLKPFKILLCYEPNETIIRQLLERFRNRHVPTFVLEYTLGLPIGLLVVFCCFSAKTTYEFLT